jgi:hypothetical protein
VSDSSGILVADASVWINLVATGRAADHLRVFGGRMVITEMALRELDGGRPKGRQTAYEVSGLIHVGLVEVVRHSPVQDDVFLSLVAGAAADTLDDGEAATLVYAHSRSSIAVIDERKATALCARRFPELVVRSTTDLFLASETFEALGEIVVIESIFAALKSARMRVPDHRLAEVVALLGSERVSVCPSLPARFRTGHSTRNAEVEVR